MHCKHLLPLGMYLVLDCFHMPSFLGVKSSSQCGKCFLFFPRAEHIGKMREDILISRKRNLTFLRPFYEEIT